MHAAYKMASRRHASRRRLLIAGRSLVLFKAGKIPRQPALINYYSRERVPSKDRDPHEYILEISIQFRAVSAGVPVFSL